MLNILTHPNAILRTKSLPVADISAPEIQELIPAMMATMLESDGIGLAAPQIGQNIRLIVIRHKDNDLVVFNPTIVKKSLLKEWGEEGCLSVPTRWGEVKRYKRITVAYTDQNGNAKKLATNGLLARVFQHEIDHLNGILFIDKARKLENIEPKLHASDQAD